MARRPFDYLVREGVPNLIHNVRDVGVAVVASNTCTFQPKDHPVIMIGLVKTQSARNG